MTEAAELEAVFAAAVAVVRDGGVAVVDVHVTPGYTPAMTAAMTRGSGRIHSYSSLAGGGGGAVPRIRAHLAETAPTLRVAIQSNSVSGCDRCRYGRITASAISTTISSTISTSSSSARLLEASSYSAEYVSRMIASLRSTAALTVETRNRSSAAL